MKRKSQILKIRLFPKTDEDVVTETPGDIRRIAASINGPMVSTLSIKEMIDNR